MKDPHLDYFEAAAKVLGPNNSDDLMDQFLQILNISNRYTRVIDRVAKQFMDAGNERAAKRVLIGSIRSYQSDINGG